MSSQSSAEQVSCIHLTDIHNLAFRWPDIQQIHDPGHLLIIAVIRYEYR
jgi:hypothetical protein